ncbi:MAG: hypothetical protein OEY56_06120 [Cyclobacteriaceae bacterium]|nr:hypothetical protein [Cyclobacteriaceae bacterium]
MAGLFFDIVLCGISYTVLLVIIFWKKKDNTPPIKPENDEGEGGILTCSGPKLDLPPGVSWPVDGSPKHREKIEEELLA